MEERPQIFSALANRILQDARFYQSISNAFDRCASRHADADHAYDAAGQLAELVEDDVKESPDISAMITQLTTLSDLDGKLLAAEMQFREATAITFASLADALMKLNGHREMELEVAAANAETLRKLSG